MSNPLRKPAAIYLRYSTDEQGEGAYTTIDAQRERLTVFAAETGYQIVSEYRDEGRTGTNLRRPGYRQMLAAAKAREFSAVLVTFMDRLGRGKTFTIAEYELGAAGAQVVTALQVFGTGTAGYISQSARQMVDGIYPQLVKEWTEAKMVQMLAAGYHTSGRVPFGYRAVPVEMANVAEGKRPPKRLEVDPEAAEIVREAYRRAADGDGKAAILAYLAGATQEHWTFDKVSRLLASRVYRGVATWGIHVNESAHLPILDEELWREVQEEMSPQSRADKANLGGATGYYLRGRVMCSCGRRMTPYWSKGRLGGTFRYYQCLAKREGLCRGAGSISAPLLHRVVFVEAAVLGRSPWRLRGVMEEARKRLPDLVQARGDGKRIRREVQRLEREKERFLAAIRVSPSSAMGLLTQGLAGVEEEWRAARRQEAEIEQALAASATLPTTETMQSFFLRLGELWAAATEEERSEIAALLVEDVTVEPGRALVRYALENVLPTEEPTPKPGTRMRVSRGRVSDLDSVKGPNPGFGLTPTASNRPPALPFPYGRKSKDAPDR